MSCYAIQMLSEARSGNCPPLSTASRHGKRVRETAGSRNGGLARWQCGVKTRGGMSWGLALLIHLVLEPSTSFVHARLTCSYMTTDNQQRTVRRLTDSSSLKLPRSAFAIQIQMHSIYTTAQVNLGSSPPDWSCLGPVGVYGRLYNECSFSFHRFRV